MRLELAWAVAPEAFLSCVTGYVSSQMWLTIELGRAHRTTEVSGSSVCMLPSHMLQEQVFMGCPVEQFSNLHGNGLRTFSMVSCCR